MELLSGYGKSGVKLDLLSKEIDIEDTEYLSKYFVLSEFPSRFSAGKNSILFNGSDLLKKKSEIFIECLDSNGNNLYIELTTSVNLTYSEAATYVVSIHVYNENVNGVGKLILMGTTVEGDIVRWVGNILIDKRVQNTSPVRFYNRPTLEVKPILSYVLNPTIELTKLIVVTGSFYSNAINPAKDTHINTVKNVDLDYRLFTKESLDLEESSSFDKQMEGFDIDLYVNTIQEPYSTRFIAVNQTSSFKVKEVINKKSIKLNDAFTYKDFNKNDVTTNIIQGKFSIQYPFISYNTDENGSNYLSMDDGINVTFIRQSFADIIYRNLRTFSGFIARHKVYRKSLFSPGDFEVISDEPLSSKEMLVDNLTFNKSFDKLGYFYNNKHIQTYWFSSNSNLQLTQSSLDLMNGMEIKYNGNYSDLQGFSNYIIVKNDVSQINRNANYLPFDEIEYLNNSGSSYDSNFIELKKNVQYILSFKSVLKKDLNTLSHSDASLQFCFTSSNSDLLLQSQSFYNQKGLLKLAEINFYEPTKEKYNLESNNFLFSVNHDMYGTLVILPNKCTAIISELSLRPYGDYGFSPDILITRVPFPINIANESFEIKSELFDINSNLVYSDLRTINTFDPSGSSLVKFIAGYKDPSTLTFLSGSLEVSKSLWVNEDATIEGDLTVLGGIYFPGIISCPNTNTTTRRFLAVNPNDGYVCSTILSDITSSKSEHVSVTFKGNETFRLIPAVEGRRVTVEKRLKPGEIIGNIISNM